LQIPLESLEQQDHALTKERMIIDYQNFHRSPCSRVRCPKRFPFISIECGDAIHAPDPTTAAGDCGIVHLD
jgi:hypothetical protein